MKPGLRDAVRQRAEVRYEYCRLRQEHAPFARFHVEHIIPRQHGGGEELSNLALACHHCNLHKGPNLTGVDPETDQIVPLFNPRTQRWEDHFALHESRIAGLTATGRATARVLSMNTPERLQLRAQLLAAGELD